MARTYGKLLTTLWTDQDFTALSAASQRLYMMLLSSPKMSSAGCVPLQPARWARTARDTTTEGTTRALAELVAAGYLLIDDDTEEALVRSFIKHDGGFVNPKILKGIESVIHSIESFTLRECATTELAKALVERQSKGNGKGDRSSMASGIDSTYIPEDEDGGDRVADLIAGYVDSVCDENDNHAEHYRAAVTRNAMKERAPKMRKALLINPDATDNDLRRVADIPTDEPDFYAPRPLEHDPDCDYCAGSGYKTIDFERSIVGPCDCEPPVLATVHELKAGTA